MRRARARRILVVGEIALALVLVIGAGLMIRSFRRVLDVQLGMRPEGVLKADLGVPFGRWKTGKPYSDFFLSVEERIARLPGVTSAALTTLLPLDPQGDFRNDIHLEGRPPEPPGQGVGAQITWVTPRYFRTLEIPLVRGRGFEASDGWRTQPVVVVNQAFVRRYLSDQEPVGARLRIFNGRWGDEADKWVWTVAGVVQDVHEWGADREPVPEIFIDAAQQPSSQMTLVVRTAGEPLAMLPALREEMLRIDPLVPLARTGTLEETLSTSLAARRFQMLLLGVFGAAALLLAALGLYGLIAQGVTQRTHEFGIRMALGAAPGAVLSLVLREALRLSAAGLAVGAVAALAATRALQASLYGVTATDPVTWAAVVVLLALVAAAASWLPARRATRVDPAVALRAE
jgi:putative ABC transport system permease protein